ncbi:hypothetical protein MUP29_04060 [bacterium]|nr:hypothetical protein [bacterium]
MEHVSRVPGVCPTKHSFVGYRFGEELRAALAAPVAGIITGARGNIRSDLLDVQNRLDVMIGAK